MSLRMREVISQAEEKLAEAGIEEYKNDAWLLFEHVSGLNRTQYLLRMNEDMEEVPDGVRICVDYDRAVSERCRRIPLQHITGHQVFMGVDFKVNEYVLTPRQDTEVLVEQALKICKRFPSEPEVLDMCTGSGCIAVSIKMLAGRELYMTAVDLSEQALKTAQENAGRQGCSIEFVQSDLFENLGNRKYDLIVSNPPYIRSEDIFELMEEVKNHEPRMALDGDVDGLKFYKKITEEAAEHLKPGGVILYEIGYDQAEDVSRILKEHGFTAIRTVKDLAGLDRVVMAELSERWRKDYV